MTLGDFIRHNREKNGYTLRQLAKEVDVSATWLNKIEMGKCSNISDDLAYKLAEKLQINVTELFRLTGRFPRMFMKALAKNPILYTEVWWCLEAINKPKTKENPNEQQSYRNSICAV